MVLKTLYNLNGFRESRTYVEGLSDIRFVGRGRSSDGYDEVDCYEQDQRGREPTYGIGVREGERLDTTP